ncbi:Hypothetical protein NTJ_09841 [Nesidiocoris tenuis]|uniref:Uncharacterized protein n=1 Tax=Nesidiocoris tenuis TaxID=355587 RepID=A0ABN7AYH4_9HEMI|nr:Hypothetical protein NTJ_09841 [Nesidiocoris tenuis]
MARATTGRRTSTNRKGCFDPAEPTAVRTNVVLTRPLEHMWGMSLWIQQAHQHQYRAEELSVALNAPCGCKGATPPLANLTYRPC